MNQLVTQGIILSRTDYGEADRIVTLLTPDQGKLRLMARGVRKVKSKLAGGIELFSVSHITYIQGRGDLGTLVSARLEKHYGHIVSDIERVQLGYELIRILHRATEDNPEVEYFTLLERSFAALDDATITVAIIRFWFNAQLLRLAGFSPNLHTQANGAKLEADKTYSFDFDTMSFTESPAGKFTATHIKFLRLSFSDTPPKLLAAVQGSEKLLTVIAPLIQTMLTSLIRV